MFRMVEALERAGHRCRVYLYDRHGGDLEAQRAPPRRAGPECGPRSAGRGPANRPDGRGLDACVATSWESAHVAGHPRCGAHAPPLLRPGLRAVLLPARHGVRAGGGQPTGSGSTASRSARWSPDCLAAELGVDSDVVEFGCDTTTYHLQAPGRPRSGVVCYARPGNPRRGWTMAGAGAERFHRRHPDVPIHIYGAPVRDLPFPADGPPPPDARPSSTSSTTAPSPGWRCPSPTSRWWRRRCCAPGRCRSSTTPRNRAPA